MIVPYFGRRKAAPTHRPPLAFRESRRDVCHRKRPCSCRGHLSPSNYHPVLPPRSPRCSTSRWLLTPLTSPMKPSSARPASPLAGGSECPSRVLCPHCFLHRHTSLLLHFADTVFSLWVFCFVFLTNGRSVATTSKKDHGSEGSGDGGHFLARKCFLIKVCTLGFQMCIGF